MKSSESAYVFGPVPSRRLGRSLGVDLVPHKTCSYDCIYCQLGRTTCKTMARKEWVPTGAVLDEVKRHLTCRPDYITLSGSGEPTLHSGLGDIIEHIQAMTDAPVAVLTNGALLWQPDVRSELAQADVVLPSLDAADADRFGFINRPHPSITFERLVAGLIEFRAEFTGRYWLEIMLLDGYTALLDQVRQLADFVDKIRPDKVQLNTCVRPPTEEYAMPVSAVRLAHFAHDFRPTAEVIADFHPGAEPPASEASAAAILALLNRRPCTPSDVANGLGIKPVEAVKHLANLEVRGKIRPERHGSLVYYRSTRAAPASFFQPTAGPLLSEQGKIQKEQAKRRHPRNVETNIKQKAKR